MSLGKPDPACLPEEEIRCVIDDNKKIILLISSMTLKDIKETKCYG